MTYPSISMEWGYSKSKIDAINRDVPDIKWDILFVMSDDMMFNMFGFDVNVGVDMMNWFSDGDGLLHYPDQSAKEHLATMYIAGKKYYDRFGYIYHPEFKSLWCDNLAMDIAQILGKYKYLGYQINLHNNPAYGFLPRDDMFDVQQSDWSEDELKYKEIKNRGYDLHLFQD